MTNYNSGLIKYRQKGMGGEPVHGYLTRTGCLKLVF